MPHNLPVPVTYGERLLGYLYGSVLDGSLVCPPGTGMGYRPSFQVQDVADPPLFEQLDKTSDGLVRGLFQIELFE